MTAVLVTGATGTLGRELVPRLGATGHAVLAMSRFRSPTPAADEATWVVADLPTGEGVAGAVAGVDAIIHAATSPARGSRRVDHVGTQVLLREAERARVRHVLYPSIVGIDEIGLPYYRHKTLAEHAVMERNVPYSILRATKFHPFVDSLLSAANRLPVMLLPKDFQEQPVDVGEVAQRLVEQLEQGPGGFLPEFAGPEVLTYETMAAEWLYRRESNKRILRLPVPGGWAERWRNGATTSSGAGHGRIRWSEWLEGTTVP